MRYQDPASRSSKRSFPSLYDEYRGLEGVGDLVSEMKGLIGTTLVQYDIVHQGFVPRYHVLVEELKELAHRLFEQYQDGTVRFEFTKDGIKMLFKTDLYKDGVVFTIIEVGWFYGDEVINKVDDSIRGGWSMYDQLVSEATAVAA